MLWYRVDSSLERGSPSVTESVSVADMGVVIGVESSRPARRSKSEAYLR
jgi:hypothetical protein